MFVTEFIGDDFTKWGNRLSAVFIQTPTQSGKTTFFFDFLDWALNGIERKPAQILLLVSRKALLQKVDEDLRRYVAKNYPKVIEIFQHVTITTYQRMEYCMSKGHGWNGSYDFIFCDEVHYFLCDAGFNPNTFMSYRWLLNTRGVKVFMSAPLKNMKNRVLKDTGFKKYDPAQRVHTNREYMEYKIPADYSQYEISYFSDEKVIPNIIGLYPDEKWGIFLTNKKRGASLNKEIAALGYSTSFVDTEFAERHASKTEMENIVTNECFNQQILIATPVLDTDINLFDKALKNVIVMANSPETFIQMLGRKRRLSKDEKIRLFIPRRSVNYFDVLARTMCENRIKPLEEIIESDTTIDDLLANRINSVTYESIENSCFVDNGNFVPNPLSIVQLFYEYGEVIDNLNGMKHDKFYFLKKQLLWLGFDEDKFDEANFVEHTLSRDVRGDITKFLEENVGKVMRKEEFEKILSACEKLITQVQPKIVKNGRTFSFGKLNEFCQNSKIPFVIKSKGGNKLPGESKTFTTYHILRTEDS